MTRPRKGPFFVCHWCGCPVRHRRGGVPEYDLIIPDRMIAAHLDNDTSRPSDGVLDHVNTIYACAMCRQDSVRPGDPRHYPTSDNLSETACTYCSVAWFVWALNRGQAPTRDGIYYALAQHFNYHPTGTTTKLVSKTQLRRMIERRDECPKVVARITEDQARRAVESPAQFMPNYDLRLAWAKDFIARNHPAALDPDYGSHSPEDNPDAPTQPKILAPSTVEDVLHPKPALLSVVAPPRPQRPQPPGPAPF